MRTRNESLIQSVTEQYVKNSDLKEKLYGYVSISKDLPARIDVYYRDMHVCSEGAVVQPAQKRPLTEEEIRRRLMKTGGTPFEFDQLEIFLEEDCYMTVQELNQFRREALDTVERAVLTPFKTAAVDFTVVE